MRGEEIEKAAAYIRQLNDAGTDHVKMFELCAKKFPNMRRGDFKLAIEIAKHDTEAE